jgi:hypothetical protein
MLTKWLDSKQIAYDKKITDTDDAIMNEFMSVNDGMIGVPFSVITNDNGEVTKISGFEKGKFEEVFNL